LEQAFQMMRFAARHLKWFILACFETAAWTSAFASLWIACTR